MSDWSHGYNVSLGYTYGFYREIAPDWLDFCARIAGNVPPARQSSGAFRYLELGSGQGFGLCLLAAANPEGEFVGIDFNPQHVAHATAVARSAGLENIRFIEGDFSELGANWPQDLGQFEYVVMHGIYSWIPLVVRLGLVRCLDHACVPGGLVYNSYNTKPGWVSTMPFQHMARRMQIVGARSGPDAIDAAVQLFESLGTENSAIFRVLPTLKARVDTVKTQNRPYLVQEYLHDNWHPLWFSEVVEEFDTAKLQYVGSGTVSELMLPGLLAAPLRDLINSEPDPVFRQEVQDCAINQSFRRDIFCRGGRKGFGRGFEAAMETIFHLISAPHEEALKISTSFGEVSIKQEHFGPAIEALESGPKTLAELVAVAGMQPQGQASAIQNIMLLVHAGALAIGRPNAAGKEASQRLNKAIAKAVSGGAPYGHLAVPALGSALATSDIDCMLLDTWLKNPKADAEALGNGLKERLGRLGRSLAHQGQPLEGDALAERISTMSRAFIESNVPRWRKLGAIP
ncbi:methyltransferase regulatory domain-containing protein [Novosphingobium aquae]|uniref:Methyltransferase regulatory domain-containing protein n=1 Tax=Novosphingobium aquae TaxID=3133435 RepID=A0ABU8S991_9SPHN